MDLTQDPDEVDDGCVGSRREEGCGEERAVSTHLGGPKSC